MAKSKQIGVRFDMNLLHVLEEDHKCATPQQALNFLTTFYMDHATTPVRSQATRDFEKIFSTENMIKAYQYELAHLGKGTLADKRRKFLQLKIKELKDEPTAQI